MKNSLETRLGLFFALACVAGFVLFEMAGGGSFFHPGREIRARFNSVQDLKAGDPVRLAGVMVGRVRAIRFAPNESRVEVVLKLDRAAVVKTDSRASILFTGLMGQNFVSLTFGSPGAPALEPGGLVESTEQADLGQLMAKLEGVADGVKNMTRSFSGEEFSKLLGPFTDFLRDNSPKLATILGNMANISTLIADGKGTVGKLITDDTLHTSAITAVTNLNHFSAELEGFFGDAKGLVADARTAVGQTTNVVAGMQRGEGTVGRLLKDEKLYTESTTAMTNLREILGKINQGQGTVGKLVNDESFLKNVKMTLQKVDKATEGLEDTGPMSILGTLIQTLF